MKTILTTAVLLIAGIVSAQENNYNDLLKRYQGPKVKKLPQHNFKNYYDMRRYPTTTPRFNVPSAPPSAELLATLPNGNKVYALPQDNMPCIVPTNEHTMPNAGSNNQLRRYPALGAIPNPAPKTIIIPKEPDNQPSESIQVLPDNQ